MAKSRRASRRLRKSRKALRKRSRKIRRGGSLALKNRWIDYVNQVFQEMKAINPNTTRMEAMKEAMRRRKEGANGSSAPPVPTA